MSLLDNLFVNLRVISKIPEMAVSAPLELVKSKLKTQKHSTGGSQPAGDV
jgi:hypothetical protein